MKFEEVVKQKEDIFKDSILTCYRGSHAHGTFLPSTDPNSIDDIDVMSVVVPSLDNYFGISQWGSSGTRDFWVEEWDCVAYELKKFIGLMFKSNPNVLSQLWCRDEDVLQITYEGKLLRESRELFYSAQAFNAFIGYAKSQLDKITRLDKDDIKKFKDLEKRIAARGYNMDTIMQKNPDDLGEDANIVSEYQYIKTKYYSGYMGDKRKEIVHKFGYDPKNSAHCIRLLKMGIEYVDTGILNVYRTDDAQEIIDIKTGKWELEDIHKYATQLFEDFRGLEKKAFDELPKYPDKEKVNKLCLDILESRFYGDKHEIKRVS